jgi:hypothetical protein
MATVAALACLIANPHTDSTQTDETHVEPHDDNGEYAG